MTTLIEKIVGEFGDERRRAYRARVKALPAGERGFYKEVERGINKERARLVNAIERAEAQDGRSGS